MKQCKLFKTITTLLLVLAMGINFNYFATEAQADGLPTGSMYVDHVNPLIGTHLDPAYHGNTWPGQNAGVNPWVTTPFGMTKWTPQTYRNGIGMTSYLYSDTKITGFMATHQPCSWMGDYGYLTMMPGVGTVKTDRIARGLEFFHEDEVSTPYYYSVEMDTGLGNTIKGEMTATSRSAALKFTYPRNSQSSLYIEMTRAGYAADDQNYVRGRPVVGMVEIDAEKGEISGYNPDRMDDIYSTLQLDNFKGYYVIQFSKPFKDWGVTQGSRLLSKETRIVDENVGAYVTFETSEGEAVEVRVGSSFISVDQARENLKKEIPSGLSFNDVKTNLKNLWEDKLDTIEIEGASEDEMAIFYTAMYRAQLFPAEFSEYGRYYSAYDDKVHYGESYTSFGLWDVFRAEIPLITLLAPERVDGIVQSLLNSYKEGGYMPKWPNPSYTGIMIGTHADSVVAEAIAKGFDGFDYDLAYEACFKDGMVPPESDTTTQFWDRQTGLYYEARSGLTYLMEKGYIPVDRTGEAASRTLEGAYDDWCIAQVAKAAGKMDDYKYFHNRSQAYKNMFNPSTKLLQGRNFAGSFVDGGWTEGLQKDYAYCVLQDFGGLMELMGEDFFNTYLDSYFATGQNDHKNEPSHHCGYLYDFSGQPWKTQKIVHTIAEDNYENTPRGLSGNDDCGQTSAWYVFTSLGFYPVNPASTEYMIGSPFFDKATIHYADNDFVITANNSSDANIYIQSATLNGDALNIPIITHEQIVNGGEVVFEMGSTASTWASSYRPTALETYADAEAPTVPDWMKHSEPEINGNNLALSAVCADVEYKSISDAFGPTSKINDGKYDTGFASANKIPQYITFTWDEPQTFNTMALYTWGAQTQGPYNWDIEVSDNGVDNWRLITNSGDIAWPHNDTSPPLGETIPFALVENVKGFRIKINKATAEWGHYLITEIEIYNIEEEGAKNVSVEAVSFYKGKVEKGNEIIALSSGTIIGNVEVTAGDDPADIIVIMALYKPDGSLEQYSMEEFSVAQDKKLSVSMDMPEKDLLNYTLQLMVWDGESYAPLSGVNSII